MGAHMMFDHPGWSLADDGTGLRAVRRDGAVEVITARPAGAGGHHVEASAALQVDRVDPDLLAGPGDVLEPLRSGGPVGRVANPDLWDALATGIVRQVIRAAHARALYREFCRAHGDRVETQNGPAWLFPTPDTILALPDSEFTRLGMAFKRAPLRAAASAYLIHHRDWVALPAADLVTAVQQVPRIGPWTAGAAVADATNDFSLYPFADLAVRTWAQRLAPACDWPSSEPEFAVAWRGLAGDQLSDWTLLTLAWGVRHAKAQGAAAL